MSITLYQAPMSSSSPIVWVLAELGLDYESVAMDLKGDEHKKPEFLALNPMGQVPTLVDDGQAMFESSAITIYLGAKYGVDKKLWPEIGSAEHMVALTWIAWFAVTVGATLRQIFLTDERWAEPGMQHQEIHGRAQKRLDELMHILDGHLADREYVVGSYFTVADAFLAACAAWVIQGMGYDPSSTPNMKAWVGRCMAREGAGAMNV